MYLPLLAATEACSPQMGNASASLPRRHVGNSGKRHAGALTEVQHFDFGRQNIHHASWPASDLPPLSLAQYFPRPPVDCARARANLSCCVQPRCYLGEPVHWHLVFHSQRWTAGMCECGVTFDGNGRDDNGLVCSLGLASCSLTHNPGRAL